MPMSTIRGLAGVCGLFVVTACGDKYAMVTAALMTDPEDLSTGDGTDTDKGTGTEQTPTTSGTGGDPSGSPGSDPTEQTTDASVPCDSPEGCTGMGGGDISPLALPFFRGKVCVSDEVKPGDKVALWLSTCAHPCLDVGGYKYKWVYRYTQAGFEIAVVFYHPDTSGTACPPDVFGEFPAESCVYTTPKAFAIGPVKTGDDDWVGPATLTVPFFSNEDAATFYGGMDDAATVWARVASHTQASDRTFTMSFDAGNEAAPGECGEGVGGCTCRSIGL